MAFKCGKWNRSERELTDRTLGVKLKGEKKADNL